MNEDLQNLLYGAIVSPENAFPIEKAHLAERLNNAVVQLASKTKLDSRADLFAKILEVLNHRSENRPDTLFIVNPGGSGSHWLQDVIAKHFQASACGEVYIPPNAIQFLKKDRPQGRGSILDFFHLISSGSDLSEAVNTSYINTAHLNGWRLSAWMPKPKTIILLARDPVDVVLSRTFRKPHYRNLYFKNETDLEYLNRNIDYIRSFYTKKIEGKYDLLVKYEDMKRNMSDVLRLVASNSKLVPKFEGIETSISFNLREPPLTSNKFKGETLGVDDFLLQHSFERLADIRYELGYPVSIES